MSPDAGCVMCHGLTASVLLLLLLLLVAAVLRHMARIGCYREAFLSPDLITAHGTQDNVTFIR
jgi:hypothetical protein